MLIDRTALYAFVLFFLCSSAFAQPETKTALSLKNAHFSIELDTSVSSFAYNDLDHTKSLRVKTENLSVGPKNGDANLLSLKAKYGDGSLAHIELSLFEFGLKAHVLFEKESTFSQIFETGDAKIFGVWESTSNGHLNNNEISAALTPLPKYADTFGANARAPFFLTSSGFAVYVDTTDPIRFSFVNGNSTFEIRSKEFTYFIFSSDEPKNLLFAYNKIAGPSRVPPDWSLRSIWWRDDYIRGPGTPYEHAMQDLIELKKNGINAGALLIDRPYGSGNLGWGNFDILPSFNIEKILQAAKEADINLIYWIANRASGALWRDGKSRGYLFPAKSEKEWPAVDLRNNEAKSWFIDNLSKLKSFGAKGFKLDRGDEGEMPAALTARMSELSCEAAGKAFVDNQYLLLARSAYDKARSHCAIWSGDPESSFDGLRGEVIHALRSGLINFPFWGSDTGGYRGKSPSKELFARWFFFSALSPLMEVMLDQNGKIFWDSYDAELIEIAKKADRLHSELIPYTKAALENAALTGMPVMRALWLLYPKDPGAWKIEDQYMYGDDYLVAPILEAGATARQVYFPAGVWKSYWDDSLVKGPVTIEVIAGLDQIPLFVRVGRGEEVR